MVDIHKLPVPVKVHAFERDSFEPSLKMDGKRIDFRDSSDRKWLMNSLMWAMNHNVTVTLSPESN